MKIYKQIYQNYGDTIFEDYYISEELAIKDRERLIKEFFPDRKVDEESVFYIWKLYEIDVKEK